MKLNHYFALFFAMIFISCSKQPIGNTLLSSAKSGSPIDTTTNTDEGELSIQADNSAMTVFIDNSNKVEITGKCSDLDRKKNRIIVEVFAGEDETVDPYISNSFSDLCQNVTSNAGLLPTDPCFWVTKGIGVIEDAGLLTQRSFPQCHDGRFGFAVKLGKILLSSTPGINNKYTVRFKLRTMEGILADSGYGRVTVARDLNTPVINATKYDATTTLQCNIQTSPARFNFGILYSLNRTCTDAAGAPCPLIPLYPLPTNLLNTSTILDGSSVFSWNDVPNGGANIILQGVTYNYTLTSSETNFSYLPSPAPTKTSSVVTCKTDTLHLSPTPPAPTPAPSTCYMQLLTRANPNFGGAVSYQWGYNVTSNWVGADSSAQAGFIVANCNGTPNTTACTQNAGLVAGTTYYFAVREVGGGNVSKWSDVFSCKPP